MLEGLHFCAATLGFRYVNWAACTTRDQEMEGVEEEPFFKIDKVTGFFKEFKSQIALSTDMGTDLMLRNAMTRRDFAFDNCRLELRCLQRLYGGTSSWPR